MWFRTRFRSEKKAFTVLKRCVMCFLRCMQHCLSTPPFQFPHPLFTVFIFVHLHFQHWADVLIQSDASVPVNISITIAEVDNNKVQGNNLDDFGFLAFIIRNLRYVYCALKWNTFAYILFFEDKKLTWWLWRHLTRFDLLHFMLFLPLKQLQSSGEVNELPRVI